MTRKRSIGQVARAKRGVTFDTGMLIALERRKASALAVLRACRLSRARITIPAAVISEWWRGAGELLARTGRSNAIAAIVIASAAQREDIVVTSDPDDLRELARLVSGVDVSAIG